MTQTATKIGVNDPGYIVPKEFEERIDMERGDIYPKQMMERHTNRYVWAMKCVEAQFGRVGTLIDFGCGTGYGSKMLTVVAHRVIGHDINEEALGIAENRHGSSILEFIYGNESAYKGLSKPFSDVVSCIEAFEHFKFPDLFLSSAFNSLRPGGMLLLTTPERTDAGKPNNEYHEREYNKHELATVVSRSGLKVENVEVANLFGFSNLLLVARKPL